MNVDVCTRPVAIVTWASRGIGSECALALAQSGFNLLLNSRDGVEDRELLQQLAGQIASGRADALPFAADIAALDVHGTMIGAAFERWGRLDCLVNNAGVSARQRGDSHDVTTPDCR